MLAEKIGHWSFRVLALRLIGCHEDVAANITVALGGLRKFGGVERDDGWLDL